MQYTITATVVSHMRCHAPDLPLFLALHPACLEKQTKLLLFVFLLMFSWADVSDDKYARVALAFLRRKKRLGMMVKLLTKLITSSSKVSSSPRQMRSAYVELVSYVIRIVVRGGTMMYDDVDRQTRAESTLYLIAAASCTDSCSSCMMMFDHAAALLLKHNLAIK